MAKLPTILNLPLASNGKLGEGDITQSAYLGGVNKGLHRTLTMLASVDVINALSQAVAANPQAVMVLTGTNGTTVQPPGTIGVGNPKLADAVQFNPVLSQKLSKAGKL